MPVWGFPYNILLNGPNLYPYEKRIFTALSIHNEKTFDFGHQ